MNSLNEWRRVTRSAPCPVCEHADWCTVAADGTAACCMRIESPKRLRNGGYLHRLGPADRRPERARRVVLSTVAPAEPGPDLATLAAQYRAAVNQFALVRLVAELGVDRAALWRLGIGWDGEAWTFPMRDAVGRVVGIRRRLPSGRKLSVLGGREGLFVPDDLPASGLLLVTEGPTDCAALLGLGFACIGRPSCAGGVALVGNLARGRDVVIVADADEPGRRGAHALALALVLLCPMVRTIYPPDGTKDAREWTRRGATRVDIERAIAAAEPMRLGIKTSAVGREPAVLERL